MDFDISSVQNGSENVREYKKKGRGEQECVNNVLSKPYHQEVRVEFGQKDVWT